MLTIKKDLLSASRALCRLYGRSRRHKPSTRTPELLPSTLCVLSTAIIFIGSLSKSWSASLSKVCPVRPLRCHLRCSRPSSGDVVKPLSSYGNYRSGSRRSLLEKASGSRHNGTCWINRAFRKSSPIRHSSDDIVKPLSTYGQLPFRSAIFWRSLQENLLRKTLTPVATCTFQLLTELF
ncbi:hypothetical protein DPMN_050582 [Dreissena polymorpha]|uniref:Uncharacterized protein n=1 Tax=Dreissena polymorpha TaxID=45954 RepID=A0A9D4CGE8_DREPO|nr:hypothetical protein DPMN_050582 [Dreissena polymorpha]